MKIAVCFLSFTVLAISCSFSTSTPINGHESLASSRLLNRIRRQIWGGSYNMIFARQQCDDKPCWRDDECCRGYSCYHSPSSRMSIIPYKTIGVCLDDVDILKLEVEHL